MLKTPEYGFSPRNYEIFPNSASNASKIAQIGTPIALTSCVPEQSEWRSTNPLSLRHPVKGNLNPGVDAHSSNIVVHIKTYPWSVTHSENNSLLISPL